MYAFPCPPHDTVIEKLEDRLSGLKIIQIGHNRIEEFTRFAFVAYKNYMRESGSWRGTKKEFNEMLEKEKQLAPNSLIIALEHEKSKTIVAGIRGTKWTDGVTFPTEDKLGVSVFKIAREQNINPHKICHGSQQFINEDRLFELGYGYGCSKRIFLALFIHAICSMTLNDIELIIAETDPITERNYGYLGIKWTPASDWGDCMGLARASILKIEDVLKVKNFQHYLFPALAASSI